MGPSAVDRRPPAGRPLTGHPPPVHHLLLFIIKILHYLNSIIKKINFNVEGMFWAYYVLIGLSEKINFGLVTYQSIKKNKNYVLKIINNLF
jgi:hypothetical protein